MALIGKIREKSWLLIVIVGIALIAFILPELGKNQQTQFYPGTVFGENIENAEYDAKVNQTILMDQQEAQQQGKQYTQEDQDNSTEKAWQALVEEKVMQPEMEALQIGVSDKEVEAYLLGVDGFKVLPNIEQQFVDSTGKFNRRALEQQIDRLKTSKDPKEVQSWKSTVDGVKEQRRMEKYMQLLSLTPYVTKLEAQEEYVAQNEVKQVAYVGKKFNDISDEEINVKDSDIKKYYDEHKEEKKWETVAANRDVSYFSIPLNPSAEDISKFNNEISMLKEKFEKTNNDSVFVFKNSDFRFYSKDHQFTFLPEGNPEARQGLTYPANMDSIFKHAPIGSIVGPYMQGNTTNIAKVIGKNKYLLSAKHILLSATDSASFIKERKLADSLVKFINHDNFTEYVQKYSKDPGSLDKGGEYDDFMDYKMVPEFSKFVVDNPVGKIGVVKTQFGIHIIEVIKKEEVNYPILALVQKTLVPSDATEAGIKNMAYDMIEKIDARISKTNDIDKKIALFDTIARQNNFFVTAPITIYDNSPRINVLSSQVAKDNIIKLAYDPDVKVGLLGSVPYKDNDKYIIAMVSAIRAKGVPSFEDIKSRMKFEVIKEKKAKRIESMLFNTKSLDAAASKLGTQVDSASVTFANPQLGSAGYEPKIIGALFDNIKDGQLTAPLEGDNGVYVVKIIKTTKASKTDTYEVQRMQLLNIQKQGTYNQVRQALYKEADPVDSRKFNQFGIIRD